MISTDYFAAEGSSRRVAPEGGGEMVDLAGELTRQKMALPPVPDRFGPPTISLALLLDFAIQHTFHGNT